MNRKKFKRDIRDKYSLNDGLWNACKRAGSYAAFKYSVPGHELRPRVEAIKFYREAKKDKKTRDYIYREFG